MMRRASKVELLVGRAPVLAVGRAALGSSLGGIVVLVLVLVLVGSSGTARVALERRSGRLVDRDVARARLGRSLTVRRVVLGRPGGRKPLVLAQVVFSF